MPEISREEIDHLAKLSRLTLSAAEKEKFTKQLPDIISFIDQLRIISGSTKNADANLKTVPLARLRPDEESGEGLSLDQLQKLAPAWHDGQLKVPAVFGEVEDV